MADLSVAGKRNVKYRRSFRRPFRLLRNYAFKRGYLGTSGKNRVHSFKRTFELLHAEDVKNSIMHGAQSFSLDLLPDYSEYIALFDKWRIQAVKCVFIFDANSNDVVEAGTSTAKTIPNIVCVRDYDDDTALTSIDDYMQYEDFKIKRFDKPYKVYLKPRAVGRVYAGVTDGFVGLSRKAWMDCASPDCPFYGIKWTVDGSTGGSIANDTIIGRYSIYCTVYFQCKDVR